MLEKRSGRIGLKGEGPLHELLVIEVETKEGPEERLGWCVLCGNMGGEFGGNWQQPCPAKILPPLDRCEFDGPDGKCHDEGAVLLNDDRWFCNEHAIAAENDERAVPGDHEDTPPPRSDGLPRSNPLLATWNGILGMLGLLFMVACMAMVGACFGVPSLVHQPTAFEIYDHDWVLISPHAIHPVDRAINQIASCAPALADITAKPRYNSTYYEAAGLGTPYSDVDFEFSRRKRNRFGELIFKESGLVLDRNEHDAARGIRALFQADLISEHDLNVIKNAYSC